jgi:hypothetical protein
MAVRRYSDATKYSHFIYYACPGNYQAWKPDRCGMKAGRIDRIDSAVKGKLEKALKNPEWAVMQSMRHTDKKDAEGINRQLKLLDFQIEQAESKITTVQDHVERQTGIYTLPEAENRITRNREIILIATRRKEELEAILAKLAQDNTRSDRTKEAFQKIHEENIKRSTFANWLRIVEILDARVYPSEDWCDIKVTTAVDLASLDGDRDSNLCYKINIASPKL